MKKTLSNNILLSAALLASSSAFATQEGDWLVRARLINVNPDSSSGEVIAGGTPVAGSGVTVKDNQTLDIDITYMVSNHFGVELLLDISSRHDVYGAGTLPAVKLLEAQVLPPALIAQYHFTPESNVRPYVGVGLNYTAFFKTRSTPALDGTLGGPTSIDLDSSTGLVFQAGVDIDINKEWFANIDIKQIDIDTTATMNTGGTISTVDVQIDPVVLGIGIGKRF